MRRDEARLCAEWGRDDLNIQNGASRVDRRDVAIKERRYRTGWVQTVKRVARARVASNDVSNE